MSTKPHGKSWKDVNREFKERRKKWREERLIKKARIEEEKQNEQEKTLTDEKINFEVRKVSTISIAIPGSIIDNVQGPKLRTILSGQIARLACIYQIDEIIVFDDKGEITENERKKLRKDDVLGEARPGCLQLARILQYCECPQYLRKKFFPAHQDLEQAGLLHPLQAPHHLREYDKSLYREGIVGSQVLKDGKGSLVNVGLKNNIRVDKTLTQGLRVTVKIPKEQTNPKKIKGIVVPPSLPRSESGIYWGYSVRLASNISEIFAKCPYPEGYDVSIGTSDKGRSVDEIAPKSLKYKHALIVFGGLLGLEEAIDSDENLKIDDPSLLFDYYLNTCPQQGSRTIRTEEAVPITLAELRTKWNPEFPPLEHPQFPQDEYKNELPSLEHPQFLQDEYKNEKSNNGFSNDQESTESDHSSDSN